MYNISCDSTKQEMKMAGPFIQYYVNPFDGGMIGGTELYTKPLGENTQNCPTIPYALKDLVGTWNFSADSPNITDTGTAVASIEWITNANSGENVTFLYITYTKPNGVDDGAVVGSLSSDTTQFIGNYEPSQICTDCTGSDDGGVNAYCIHKIDKQVGIWPEFNSTEFPPNSFNYQGLTIIRTDDNLNPYNQSGNDVIANNTDGSTTGLYKYFTATYGSFVNKGKVRLTEKTFPPGFNYYIVEFIDTDKLGNFPGIAMLTNSGNELGISWQVNETANCPCPNNQSKSSEKTRNDYYFVCIYCIFTLLLYL